MKEKIFFVQAFLKSGGQIFSPAKDEAEAKAKAFEKLDNGAGRVVIQEVGGKVLYDVTAVPTVKKGGRVSRAIVYTRPAEAARAVKAIAREVEKLKEGR